MTFHCNARYFLLTYSQCGELDPWKVSDHLGELRGECIVAREAHADGGTHLHAFVDFGRKFRSRRTSIFDVDNHHPNVSATHSTPREGFDYACKDGDIVAGGLGRPEPRNTAKRVPGVITYSAVEIVTSHMTIPQFQEILMYQQPYPLGIDTALDLLDSANRHIC